MYSTMTFRGVVDNNMQKIWKSTFFCLERVFFYPASKSREG